MAKWSERDPMRVARREAGRRGYKSKRWVFSRQVRGPEEVGDYPDISWVTSVRRVKPRDGWYILAKRTLARIVRYW